MVEIVENEEYTIDGIVNKLKGAQTLSSEELVWFSKQISNGAIDWSDNIDNSWVKQLLPQLEAEMGKSIKEGETSRDLRDSNRDDLFKVSQVQRRARGKDGQLWYQEIKQRNAAAAAKEANSTFVSKVCLEHMKIKKELPDGINLEALIKEQQEASNISGWRHPIKKLRSHRTLKSLEKLQSQLSADKQPKKAEKVQTFLDTVNNGGVKTPSLWARVRHPLQSREQSKELGRLLDALPSSELAADGRLMKGLDTEIERLAADRGPDKKKNKQINRKIQKLQQYKDRIAAETKKRNDEFAKKEENLAAKQEERLASAQERYSSSAEVTRNRDEKLQNTTLFSQTLETLGSEGFDVSALQEQYRKQIKDRNMDEAMAGLTDEQKNILKNITSEKESRLAEGETVAGDKPTEQASSADSAASQEDQNNDGATVENQQQAGVEYTPLKNIEYTHQVDGQEKTETYQGEAISHSAEEDRYAIDLEKAQGEDLDKACMATLAHMKENGQTSFKIDENTPVELYDSLVKAAEASGMTIENGKELETVMAEKRKQKDESHEGDAKKEEPTLTPEQQAYLVGHKLLNEDMTMEQLGKLKWSDLDNAQQERLNCDGLGQEKDDARRTEQKDRQSEKTEPQTEQEQLLTKSDALKGIRSSIGTFDQETQRYKMSSESDFQEKIAGLSPAEQRAAREIRGLQMKENTARDKAAKSGEPFDKKKEEEFAQSQGRAWGRAYEAIKKERGFSNEQPRNRTSQNREKLNEGHTPLPQDRGRGS